MFKKGLLVFQFVVSVSLIICTMVIGKQRSFMQNQDLGFNKDNVLFLSYSNEISQSFKQELIKHPNIGKLSISENPPGIGWIRATGTQWKYKGKVMDIHFSHCDIDAHFLPLVEIELKEGRHFSEELDRERHVCIINETAMKEFGIDNPNEAVFEVFREIGQKSKPAQVIGVVKDFKNESLHNKVQPFIFFYNPNLKSGFTLLKIKSENFQAIRQTIGYIEDLWKKYSPSVPFTYHFLDDWLDNMYKQEACFEKIFVSFSILAIVIACLGLFGLVSFMTEQRTKEIGIRKVFGASVTGVVGMLTKDFTRWVLLANLIAWPIAYYAMNKWLQNFAYRINIAWWVFVLASALALVIVLLTVSLQAIRVATTNPVESLRYE